MKFLLFVMYDQGAWRAVKYSFSGATASRASSGTGLTPLRRYLMVSHFSLNLEREVRGLHLNLRLRYSSWCHSGTFTAEQILEMSLNQTSSGWGYRPSK